MRFRLGGRRRSTNHWKPNRIATIGVTSRSVATVVCPIVSKSPSIRALHHHSEQQHEDHRHQAGEGDQAKAVEQRIAAAAAAGDTYASGIGTPDDMRRHLRLLAGADVDQVIFLQQAGRNRHVDICSSLELFAGEVMDEFHAGEAQREAAKQADLAPYVEAALARKEWMQPRADDEIPVVAAAVKKAIVPSDPVGVVAKT